MAYSRMAYNPNESLPSRRYTDSRSTNESYDSMDTAPTSISSTGSSSRPQVKTSVSCGPRFILGAAADESVSPATLCVERASVYSYVSSDSEDDDEDDCIDEEDEEQDQDARSSSTTTGDLVDFEEIPKDLYFRRDPRSVTYPYPSRPADHTEFAQLFPSMDRLSIRHDDRTSDGTHNLRVETTVNMPYQSSPSSRGGARHRQHGPANIQLFHLRMHDLARREFSLRRYGRDSQREVCKSTRKLSNESAPRLASAAFQKLGAAARPAFRRNQTVTAATGGGAAGRPATRDSGFSSSSDECRRSLDRSGSSASVRKLAQRPTNTVKLEFSNYARVDVSRCGSGNKKRYEFSWWGCDYRWERSVDSHTGGVSFHLIRTPSAGPRTRRGADDNSDDEDDASVDYDSRGKRRRSTTEKPERTVVARIVPEQRSPTQVEADAKAGAWVPPCYMYITDASVLEALTDVGDVIIATGLMSLVDDAIKEKWGAKAVAKRRKALSSASGSKTFGLGSFLKRGYSEGRLARPALGRMISVR